MTRGGKRTGSGRKLTGRRRVTLYLTDAEEVTVREFVKEQRSISVKNTSYQKEERIV